VSISGRNFGHGHAATKVDRYKREAMQKENECEVLIVEDCRFVDKCPWFFTTSCPGLKTLSSAIGVADGRIVSTMDLWRLLRSNIRRS